MVRKRSVRNQVTAAAVTVAGAAVAVGGLAVPGHAEPPSGDGGHLAKAEPRSDAILLASAVATAVTATGAGVLAVARKRRGAV
ncbi:hypothetical protein ACFWZ2_14830 [Streptomyces sp. NPDC059002]|uniref:hypothetical protein n=1 Tax=Streptomyces sp. NPDC059002 TaxID=3346690 RepID=UPI00367C4058